VKAVKGSLEVFVFSVQRPDVGRYQVEIILALVRIMNI
jgi:hypothetical protein